MQFFAENLKMKRKEKRTKNVDLSEQGFEPQIFSNFPRPQFQFLWKVRVTRSNIGKKVKIS